MAEKQVTVWVCDNPKHTHDVPAVKEMTVALCVPCVEGFTAVQTEGGFPCRVEDCPRHARPFGSKQGRATHESRAHGIRKNSTIDKDGHAVGGGERTSRPKRVAARRTRTKRVNP